jgi:hypothetical protein
MIRTKAKELHKSVKKMSANSCYKFISDVVINHNMTVMDDVFEVLHEELGYKIDGIRMNRFTEALNKKVKDKNE